MRKTADLDSVGCFRFRLLRTEVGESESFEGARGTSLSGYAPDKYKKGESTRSFCEDANRLFPFISQIFNLLPLLAKVYLIKLIFKK